jgi:uncharacterized tellurite resistance protein B-like protein
MERKIKESVAVLLAHIIKMDKRDVEKSAPLFCRFMKEDFECSETEARDYLDSVLSGSYDLEKHLSVINEALCNDRLSKLHIMEQLNHIIYSDSFSDEDYAEFEKIKDKLFKCDS